MALLESNGLSTLPSRGSLWVRSLPRPLPMLAVVLLFVAILTSILLVRFARSPLQPYGDDGAYYLEHIERLSVLEAWQTSGWLAPASFLREADREYPPVLHVVALAQGALFGHDAETASLLMLAWMLLLSASVAWLVRASGGSSRAAMAAAAGTICIPAVHGCATRYYFDLPMTAVLWSAVAVFFAVSPRHPFRGALVSGLVFALAALTKWTAIPYGATMAVGTLLTFAWTRHREGLRWQRYLPMATAGLVIGGGLPLVLFSAVTQASLKSMLLTFQEPGTTPRLGPIALLQSMLSSSDAPTHTNALEHFGWLLSRLASAIYSWPLAGILGVLLVVWLLRSRRLLFLVVITVLGQLVFLASLVPVRDERFLLTPAPALVVAAALGWERLSPLVRRIGGVAILVVGLLLAAEFHLDVPRLQQSEPPSWAAQSSVQNRGWSRADQTVSTLNEAKACLEVVVERCDVAGLVPPGDTGGGPSEWARTDDPPSDQQVAGCVAKQLTACAAEQPMVRQDLAQACGESFWWEYRRRMATLLDESVADRYSILTWRGDDDGSYCPDCSNRLERLCGIVQQWQTSSGVGVDPTQYLHL